MNFYQLYEKLEELYPLSLRCEWDNDGIMVANGGSLPVQKVLVSLDVTEKVIDYAIANQFDTVISHHPLIFYPEDIQNPQEFLKRKIEKAKSHQIRIASFHTRLDASPNGVSETLASFFDYETISTDEAEPCGRIITLRQEEKLIDFCNCLKSKLKTPFVLFSGNLPVSKVYIIGGDGKDCIPFALQNGCDTLLTGRVSYNTAIDGKDRGLNIIEAGHFFTENPICEVLRKELLKMDDTLKVECYSSFSLQIL